MIGPDSPSQSLVATAFDLTALQQQAAAEFHSHTESGLAAACPPSDDRLLPLAGYQELRGLLDSHALLRERWLELLLPRLRRRAAAADAPPPEEEALRCQWQARLELKPAPTLPMAGPPGTEAGPYPAGIPGPWQRPETGPMEKRDLPPARCPLPDHQPAVGIPVPPEPHRLRPLGNKTLIIYCRNQSRQNPAEPRRFTSCRAAI